MLLELVPLESLGKVSYSHSVATMTISLAVSFGWLRGIAVERWSSTGELSLYCARPAADG